MTNQVGRVALVTGAGAGIGRAAALALASRRFTVVLSDIAKGPIEALAVEIAALGGLAIAVRCDVAVESEIQLLFARIQREAGGLEVLVHSAGLFPKLSFARSTLQDLDRVMSVNFRAAFMLAAGARPLMTSRGGGAMIFMTSGSGLLAAVADPMQADFSLYGASKAALDRWALGIAAELAGEGVTVNTISPGAFVLTPGVVALGLKESVERPSISPEAVAEAVVWLAERPVGGPVGERLAATDFRHRWGL